MQQLSFNWLLLTALLIAVSAENDRKKLVCSQPDDSLEGPRGHCTLADNQRECECSDDCIQGSTLECVCERSDLVYARDQGLANCTVYTQEQWDDYVRLSRNSESYKPLPAASNTPDGKGLLFSTNDQNLAWPITDALDIGGLLEHGSHCFKMVEIFNQQISNTGKLINSVDKSHYDHCRRLMRRVLAYYTDMESYNVQPESLCADLKLMPTKARSADKNKYKEKYIANHDNSQTRSVPIDEMLSAVDADKHKYKEKYGRSLPVEKVIDADADKNKYKDKYGRSLPVEEVIDTGADKNKYKDKYGRTLPGADNVKISHEIYKSLYSEFQEEGRTVTQQRLFDRISGQNLGDLLVKDWLEQVLTSDEQTFLARWESEQVVRIAAMSVYCDQGDGIAAPLEKLRNLLTNQ